MRNGNSIDVTGAFALYNSFGAKKFLDSAIGGITSSFRSGDPRRRCGVRLACPTFGARGPGFDSGLVSTATTAIYFLIVNV